MPSGHLTLWVTLYSVYESVPVLRASPASVPSACSLYARSIRTGIRATAFNTSQYACTSLVPQMELDSVHGYSAGQSIHERYL